jgi:FkbM family methyltransferase
MYDLKRILAKSPRVIVDAGANKGSVSLELSYWFADAQIYAFEPVSNTFKSLVNNTVNNRNIHPFHFGLGDKDENVEIFLSKEDTINSLKTAEANQYTIGKEIINIIRLDKFLTKHDINHIDILKIDVEGAEFEVLRGCDALIYDAIKCIYLEVGYDREPTKVHFSDVAQYMEERGFLLCGIYETRRNLSDKRRLWYSNNLYIKKELLY